VPIVVIWEVTLLARAVRVNLHRPVREFFGDLFSSPLVSGASAGRRPGLLTPASCGHCATVRRARVRRGARDLELPLITRDGVLTDSRLVRAIW
jgi:hypothetical protein